MNALERRAAATPRVQLRKGRLYWEPSADLRRRGYANKPLGLLSTDALNMADLLNVQADAREPTVTNTIATAIDTYLAQIDVRPATLRSYTRHLRRLERDHGKQAVIWLTPNRLATWARGIGEGADALGHVRSVQAFLSWLASQGEPVLRGKPKLGITPRKRRRVATRDELAALIDAADTLGRPSVRAAIVLMLTTMQRVGDVLALDTANVTAEGLHLVQSKTGTELEFGVHPAAAYLIPAGANAIRPLIVSETTRRAYTVRSFERAFAAVRAHAARSCPSVIGADPTITESNTRGTLNAGDLRRTAMVMAARSGATIAQIASVSGHTLDQTMAILEHYLPRDMQMAAAALAALDLDFIEARDSVIAC